MAGGVDPLRPTGFVAPVCVDGAINGRVFLAWVFLAWVRQRLVRELRPGDLGCYGNEQAITPNIDRLATEGVRCTDFYTGSPSCSPSRGPLLTGRHPLRTGLTFQLLPEQDIGGVGLPLDERLVPQYLKPQGYATGAFGKWNIGFAPGARSTERGFDEFFGHSSGNLHYYKHTFHGQNDLRRGTEPVDRKGEYSTDLFADAAVEFIGRNRDRPWFVYLPFNAVHFIGAWNVEPGEGLEWQVPAEYLAMHGSLPDEPDQRTRFRAVLTALDAAVGRVLTAVDDRGLRERTIVLFISDNGAFMLPGRGLEVQSNAPLREGGVTTYEGGVRVPAIVRWPGRIKPGTTCREMLSSLDVLPLVLAACGARPPEDVVLDGHDPIATLAGEAPTPHDALYWVYEGWQGVRSGPWKLVRRLGSDPTPWELYDLRDDVGESNDLAAAKPEQTRKLAGLFDRWQDSVGKSTAPTEQGEPR